MPQDPRQSLLSATGGDRATAYAMSRKALALPAGLLCTWLDADRRNRWALVDHHADRVLSQGVLGDTRPDNHCGAALAATPDAVHAVVGGHHSALDHYRLKPADLDAGWQHTGTLDVRGTYPSLAADAAGRLHLAYRSHTDRWTLDYARCVDGAWEPPRTLVDAELTDYVYWTNGLAVGPDGRLWLALGNTQRRPGGLSYGASLIASPDAGVTWHDDAGNALELPTPVARLPRIGDADHPARLQPDEVVERLRAPGPTNWAYHQMLLSNPVVDDAGESHVVLHHALTGEAELMSLAADGWRARPLTQAATAGEPGLRVHPQSSLALCAGGRLFAALMLEPTDRCVWGAPGTRLAVVEAPPEGPVVRRTLVLPPDDTQAAWLPAFAQQPASPAPPPLLYTLGRNAGGFGHNANAVETEVFLLRG